MKITKKTENGEVGLYQPDEKEKERISKVADKVIDIIVDECF